VLPAPVSEPPAERVLDACPTPVAAVRASAPTAVIASRRRAPERVLGVFMPTLFRRFGSQWERSWYPFGDDLVKVPLLR
jgi:hypothetical protein